MDNKETNGFDEVKQPSSYMTFLLNINTLAPTPLKVIVLWEGTQLRDEIISIYMKAVKDLAPVDKSFEFDSYTLLISEVMP